MKDCQVRKEIVKQAKRRIQREIRNELNILVDCIKQGLGSTNDGNTARKFFRNFETVAKITGLNDEFLKRIYIILQVICSKKQLM